MEGEVISEFGFVRVGRCIDELGEWSKEKKALLMDIKGKGEVFDLDLFKEKVVDLVLVEK